MSIILRVGGGYGGRGDGELWVLLRNFLSLYAPSGLHKGFLTVMRVWVQAAAYSSGICFFSTGGVSCGVSYEVLSLGGVLVVG